MTYTIDQLRDEQVLRRAIGAALGTTASWTDGIDFRPMPVLVQELVQKCLYKDGKDSWEACYSLIDNGIAKLSGKDDAEEQLHWWLMATSEDQAIACLVALGVATPDSSAAPASSATP